MSTLLQAMLAEYVEIKAGRSRKTFSELLAEVAMKKALGGDFNYWRAIVERTEGPIRPATDPPPPPDPHPDYSLYVDRIRVAVLKGNQAELDKLLGLPPLTPPATMPAPEPPPTGTEPADGK